MGTNVRGSVRTAEPKGLGGCRFWQARGQFKRGAENFFCLTTPGSRASGGQLLAGSMQLDDAVNGVALLRALKALDGVKAATADQKAGVDIVRRAIRVPARQIVENAGEDGSFIIRKLVEKGERSFCLFR